MMQGRVTSFDEAKYYGWIWTEAGSFFYHGNTVIGDLPKRNDIVSFWLDSDEFGHNAGKLRAVEVRRVGT